MANSSSGSAPYKPDKKIQYFNFIYLCSALCIVGITAHQNERQFVHTKHALGDNKKFHFPRCLALFFIVKYLNGSLAHFATDSTFQQQAG